MMNEMNERIPKSWIGKKVEILVDYPHEAPYQKGDIVEVISSEVHPLAVLMGVETLLMKEGDSRPYSTSKDNVRLIEPTNFAKADSKEENIFADFIDELASQVEKEENLPLGTKVKILDNPYDAPVGMIGTVVAPDMFASLLGIPFLVELENGDLKAVDVDHLEVLGATPKTTHLQVGDTVRILEDDIFGDFSSGDIVTVEYNEEYNMLAFKDNSGESRLLDAWEHEKI